MEKNVLIALIAVGVAVGAVVVLALALGIGLGVGLNDGSSGGSSNGAGAASVVYQGPLVAKCSGFGTPSNPALNVSFVTNLDSNTGWFASPAVQDLDNDGIMEIIVATSGIQVFAANYTQLASNKGNSKRVYAPHVVYDINNDNIKEIVIGQGPHVYCYQYTGGKLVQLWSTSDLSSDFEVRGLAAADLDADGNWEIIVTTTRTDGTSVFVYQGSSGAAYNGWPRYNSADAHVNGEGISGYGQYGLNVGIGKLNNNVNTLNIVATFDDHQINVFEYDGVSVNASDYYTNPESKWLGNRLAWGQFIRYYDAWVEEGYYHNHTYQATVHYNPWLQFTQSPPSVADLNKDGQAEVIAIPNVELDPSNSGHYITQYWAVIVLNGITQDSVSATRFPDWNVFPKGQSPVVVNGYYPPTSPPAPVIVDVIGDSNLEIIVSLNDGGMYCFSYQAELLWVYNFKFGRSVMFSSEPTVADLNNDGSPEIIFTTFGSPDVQSGFLVILSANGAEKQVIQLNTRGKTNGNGNGAPSAPTVEDIDGNGTLEIILQSFEHGVDIYTAVGSNNNCVQWPSARGGYQRIGAPDSLIAPHAVTVTDNQTGAPLKGGQLDPPSWPGSLRGHKHNPETF